MAARQFTDHVRLHADKWRVERHGFFSGVRGWLEASKQLELGSQIRWFSLAEEEDHFTELGPSIELKAPLLCGRAKVHVEYFSLLSDGREENYQQHYAGPGLHFLLTPNLEVGARVFWGIGEDSAEFISNAGVGVRFFGPRPIATT